MRNTKRFSKIFAVLLCAILMLGAMFAFSSCKKKNTACTHENTETTNTATCNAAGVEKIVCNDCGVTISEKESAQIPHTYAVDAASSVAATCIADGKQVLKCSVCGDTTETTVAKLGHKYQPDPVSSLAPTCSAKGVDAQKCTVCSDIVLTDVAQLGHSFKPNATLSKTATCTEAGKEVLTCEHCQQNSEKTIDATGHNWLTAEGKAAVACLDSKCEYCQAEMPASAKHDYELADDTATCIADGEKTYSCSICGGSYNEPSAKTGHDVQSWTKLPTEIAVNGTPCLYEYSHTGVCENCGEDVVETYTSIKHNYVLSVTKNATCNEAGTQQMKCTECNEINYDVPAVEFFGEHIFGEFSAPDENGKAISTCETCGEVRTKVVANEVKVNKEELKNEIQLGGETGAVIKMDETSASLVGDKDATLSADGLTKSDLAGKYNEDLSRVGEDDIIYNITLTDENGDPISDGDFQGGIVTVKLPYTLKPGDDPTRITIFFLGVNGIEEMEAVFTMTDEATQSGFVTFTTGHFSYYLVGLYDNAGLCKRFGHEYLVASKEPTCTESGYYIESCKRCGQFGRKEYTPANGHNMVPNDLTSVGATCTTAGHEDRKCANCDYECSVVIQPTGHTWVCTAEQTATCTAAGFKTYTCSCAATYTETFAQLPHKLNKVVTEATCTTQGYTTYTCGTCELNYTADYIAAFGHKWNIAEPTCAQGQVCLACEANGKPATGNHTMGADGKCTVCGLGCDHAWQVKEVIAPSCELGGYTVYICPNCSVEKTDDITKATGHIYTDILAGCTVCGKANADLAGIFENIVMGLASNSYSVRLENLSVLVEEVTTVTGLEPITEQMGTVKMDLFELTIVMTEEGSIMLYANGAVDNSEADVGRREITLYGDGEHMYISVTDVSSNSLTPEKMIQRVSYDQIFESIGIRGTVDENVPLVYSAENATPAEMLQGIIAQIQESGILDPWVALIDSNSDEIITYIGKLIFSLYKSEATENGYKYTFDLDRINELNKDLNTLTVAQLIDKYVGEGSFDKIITYLESLDTKTLATAATEIVDLFSGMGIPSELIFSTVNSIVAQITENPEFDIMAMLNNDDFKDVTVSQFVMMIISKMGESEGGNSCNHYDNDQDAYCDNCGISLTVIKEMSDESEGPTYLDYIAKIEAMANQIIIYQMIPEEVAAQVYGLLDSVLSTSKLGFSFYLDKEGNPLSAEIAINNLKFLAETYVDEIGDTVITEEEWVTINGKLTMLLTGAIPEGADAIKIIYETRYAALEESAKTAIAGLTDSTELMLAQGYNGPYQEVLGIKLNGDVLYLIVSSFSYSSAEPTVTELPLSAVTAEIYDNCTGCYEVYVSFEIEDDYYGSYYHSFRFFFNDQTNTFSDRTFHNFNTEYTGAIPEGIYTTYEEAPCGAYYGKFYVCGCGAIERNTQWKSHETQSKVTLLPGSVTCEDGIIIEYICKNCGEVSDSHIRNYHSTSIVEVFEYATAHGKIYAYKSACPCGYNSYFNFRDSKSDDSDVIYCHFKESSDSTYGSDEYGSYWIYTYNCAFEGCTAQIVEKLYNSNLTGFKGDPCVEEYKIDYTVYYNSQAVYQTTVYSYETQHSWESDGKESNYEKCSVCGMEKYYENFYDSYGRYLGYIYWTKENGVITDYTESRRQYLDNTSCRCYYGFSYEYGVPVEFDYSYVSTEHSSYEMLLVQEGTCTQPTVYTYGCGFCGETEEREYYYEYADSNGRWWGEGHSWYSTEDDDYECERCGLRSNQGNSDICMDDLSNNSDYAVENALVIGFINNYSELNVMFAFVDRTKNYQDEGATLPAALISFDITKHIRYENSGILTIDKKSVIASIELLIQDGLEISVDEFLANYDLAITMQEYQDGEYGDGYEGAYSTLVLQNLASYFN